MSLGVVIKGPEGVVLAADSRVTVEARHGDAPPIHVNFDNATKLLSFQQPHNYVGTVTYGAALIGLRTAHSFVPEFEVSLPAERLTVENYAQRLSDFYMEQWRRVMPEDYAGPNMTFIVGGYDPDAPYGRVFVIEIPRNPAPSARNPGEREFGMTWGGQLQVPTRIIFGFDPLLINILQQRLNLGPEEADNIVRMLRENLEFRIPYDVLPLQDCIDLAIFLVKTTMTAQRVSVGIRGVGGPVEVAVITRTKGLEYIQRKKLRGERPE